MNERKLDLVQVLDFWVLCFCVLELFGAWNRTLCRLALIEVKAVDFLAFTSTSFFFITTHRTYLSARGEVVVVVVKYLFSLL